ncbi:uncharacterized protein LOC127131387 [Lathyrus oleraceus]|uniref:uncharacterized protein LOC127131387 n=1 Tax=Pisum sativum TaxID=3888 RepID=UPI0021D3BC73|nr:uncharacterized protein LOC127131387 [Pisum sativum]
MIEDWNVIDQRVGSRDISDHCPICLNLGKTVWVPSSLDSIMLGLSMRVLSCLLRKNGKRSRWKGYVTFLYENIKRLKDRIREWNRTIFGWIDLKVSNHVKNLNDWDSLLVKHNCEDIEEIVNDRSKEKRELWNTLNLNECMLRLKSRQLWLKDKDKNTRFYHNSIKERNRRNDINSMEGEYGIVEGVVEIKEAVKSYFKTFFKESNVSRPVSEGIVFKSLSEHDSDWFEGSFLEDEVDVVRFVEDFHEKAKLTKACTSSFLALIPKVKNPQALSEYRHICLVDSLHKLLSKLLAARLKKVTSNIVSENQSTFVPGRSIVDGVLMINEILDMAKRENKSCVILKVDFGKAYYCALTCLMNKAVDDGDFWGFKINVEEEVNLLQFADDTIMVADGSSDNL